MTARRPILVTGMPRSGTTWVGRILTASGHVGYLNEPFNLAHSPGSFRVPVSRHYPYVTRESEDSVLPTLRSGLEFRYPLRTELLRCRSRTDLHHTARSWREFRRGRGRRPLVKEPHAVFSIDWFTSRLGSDVVVLVREPLAVVSSWKRLGWSFDFEHLLGQPALMADLLGPFELEMRAMLAANADLVGRVALLWRVINAVVADRRHPNVHVVRHEDLSLDPVGRFRELFAHVGVEFTAETEIAVAAASSRANPPETSTDRPHEIRLDSRANLGNWRHRLDGAEIERIRELTEPTASLFYPDATWA